MLHRIHAFALAILFLGGAAVPAQDPEVFNTGIVDSLVKDLSPGKRKLIATEFPAMVHEFTGFKSAAFQGGDALTAGKKLAAGEWHFAFMQGIEFAWAQERDPKVLPLIAAVGKHKTPHALLVTKKDSPIAGFADLKGKEIYLLQLKEHARLFAEKGAGEDLDKFFGKVMRTTNSEAALDDVLRGKVEAAVVDDTALESYKDVQPGRFQRLKVVAKSEAFPPKVIAYYEGKVSESVLTKFREGMFKANQTEKGRDAMANFWIESFEAVPSDFAMQLSAIRKSYPYRGN